MPNIVQGSQSEWLITGKVKSYTYPQGKDLSPKSAISKKIVDHVLRLARESASSMAERHPYWNNIDNTLNCYIRLDDKEKKSLRDDERKPVSIVFPHSYALLETTLSYLCAAFFKDPIFKYKGNTQDDMMGAKLLELVIQQQCARSKVALSLHTAFRDSLAYGVGVGVPTWETKTGKRYKKVTRGTFFKKDYLELVEDTLFEGNVLKNVDPYKYLPDPSVSATDIQKGEYFGWIDSELVSDLEVKESQGTLFNIDYVKRLSTKTSTIITRNTYLRDRIDRGTVKDNSRNKRTDVISMYVKISPKEYSLGDSEVPEKWFFAIAADSVIIDARPAGLNHDMFPVTVAAPDFDGYGATPLSRIEVMSGLQTTLDWMFNTHITNVRKTIHDMFIVDPYLVNVNDIANPEAGRLIRLRQPAWGKGVDNAIKQLPVTDVTRTHIQDAGFIVSWMNKVSGVDDASMGILRQGGPERLSSAEFQGTREGMVSRLDRVAQIISMQMMQDLGLFFAFHTQQFMSKDTYVKFYGDEEMALKKTYGSEGKLVGPFDLAVDYDVAMTDHTKQSNYVTTWKELFGLISQDPILVQQFDTGRIFQHIAQLMGASDVGRFVKSQIVSDQQALQGAQQGNMIPATPENLQQMVKDFS